MFRYAIEGATKSEMTKWLKDFFTVIKAQCDSVHASVKSTANVAAKAAPSVHPTIPGGRMVPLSKGMSKKSMRNFSLDSGDGVAPAHPLSVLDKRSSVTLKHKMISQDSIASLKQNLIMVLILCGILLLMLMHNIVQYNRLESRLSTMQQGMENRNTLMQQLMNEVLQTVKTVKE